MECCSVVEGDLIGKTLSMWFHLIRLITLLCYWGIYLLVVYLGIITWGVVTSRWSYRLSQSLRPGPPRNWVFQKFPRGGPQRHPLSQAVLALSGFISSNIRVVWMHIPLCLLSYTVKESISYQYIEQKRGFSCRNVLSLHESQLSLMSVSIITRSLTCFLVV